jgi:hypothetical protein
VSYLSIYYPCYWDLDRIIVIFYVMLSLPSLGLTMRINDGARMHEYLLCTILNCGSACW